MPYKAFKVGNKYEVKKLDADGKPTGKALGTHPSLAKANQQVKALYASEKGAAKKEIEPATAEELATKDHGEMNMGMPMMMPMMTMATSFADLMAQREADEMAEEVSGLTNDFATLAYNITCDPMIEDKAAALAKLAQEFKDLVTTYARTGEEPEDQTKEIVAQIVGDNQPKKKEAQPEPELLIWKEGDTYRWLAAYSNNRQDDEQEIISSASHKEFDEALAKKEWPMPEVYLWHIPYAIGQADYHAYDESSGFPVAAGHFYAGMEWAAEGLLKEKWDGVSHGMPERWLQYDPNNPKVITRHRTKEISFLPRWAAANKLTFSVINKEKEMAELEKGLPAHKRPDFVKMLGEERVKDLEDALANKSKEADEQGIQKKEAGEQKPLTQSDLLTGLEFVLTQVKELTDGINSRLDTLEKSQVKEADAFDIMAQLKAKSIVGKEAARVDGRSALAKDAPEETQPQAANQHPVSLINNLFAANAAWAERLSGGR